MWFRTFTLLAVLALGVSTWFLSNPAQRPQVTAGDDGNLPGYFLNAAVLTDYDASGAPATSAAPAASAASAVPGGARIPTRASSSSDLFAAR